MKERINANTLIIGSPKEYDKAVQLMKEAGLQERVLGRVAVTENDTSAIGYWTKLDMLVRSDPFSGSDILRRNTFLQKYH